MVDAVYPHCNAEVLHAPGSCRYCDLYPDRQDARMASQTPFTPAEANGWMGNVAVAPEDRPETALSRDPGHGGYFVPRSGCLPYGVV